MRARRWFCLFICAGVLPGCFFLPRGFDEQHARNRAAGENYNLPLPELPEEPDLESLLEYAWRANGEVRAAWNEWVAAVERVRDAAGYPNTNLHLGLEAMWAGKRPGWNDVTISAGNDPMTNLALPPKIAAAARVALEQARAAEANFHARRLAVRERVASTFFQWIGLHERAEIAHRRAAWLEQLELSERARFSSGAGSQEVWLAGQNARLEAENQARNLLVEAENLRRELNGLLGRAADAPLRPPREPVRGRSWPGNLEEFRAQLRAGNPELAGLRAEVAARERTLHAAQLQFLPDVNPMGAITGDVSQVAGLAFVLPLTWRKLQAQVASARALVDASRAVLRQAEADREAEVAAGLAVLENVERQQRLWTESLLPNWQLRCQSVRRAYEAGTQSLGEWVQAELARLAAEEALVELQTLREQQLVRLETLLGLPGEGGFSATQEASHAAR